jgi:hypothetical protein
LSCPAQRVGIVLVGHSELFALNPEIDVLVAEFAS